MEIMEAEVSKEIKEILDGKELIEKSDYLAYAEVEVNGEKYRKIIYKIGAGKHKRETVFYKKAR